MKENLKAVSYVTKPNICLKLLFALSVSHYLNISWEGTSIVDTYYLIYYLDTWCILSQSS